MKKEYTKEELKNYADSLAGELVKYLYSAKTKSDPRYLKKNMSEDIYKFLLQLIK